MDFHISLDGRRDLSGQIYQQVRAAILDGRLRAGEALPPSRELATRLAVSRNTVSVAYDRLRDEGFLAGRVGAGTYVSPGIRARSTGRLPGPGVARPRAVWDESPEPPEGAVVEPELDFRCGGPDVSRFPFATWRALVADQLRERAVGKGIYGDPAGDWRLRAAIARHLGVSRGVSATADEVLVTNGIQQAADLAGRVLLAPGEVVAVEDPGWSPPRQLFQTLGAQVIGVPVDEEGLVVDALPDQARLVYVTPSHHLPLGVAMSLPRRLALLEWAGRTGALIVEDDYDSEFRFTGRPLEPLQRLDQEGRVLYLGSFSKSMLLTLRLGYCIPPPGLFGALRKAKYLTDLHTSLPLQLAMARFIEEGMFARHVRRMRWAYQERRDRIALMLDQELAGELVPIPAVAGLHLAAWLRRPGVDDETVAARAAQVGVGVGAVSSYAFAGPVRPGLVFGYSAIPTGRIDEGLRRLLRCFDPDR